MSHCSYLIPVLNHWILYFGWATCQRNGMPEQSAFWSDTSADGVQDDTAKSMEGGKPSKGRVAGIDYVGTQQHMMDTGARMEVDPKQYTNNYRCACSMTSGLSGGGSPRKPDVLFRPGLTTIDCI